MEGLIDLTKGNVSLEHIGETPDDTVSPLNPQDAQIAERYTGQWVLFLTFAEEAKALFRKKEFKRAKAKYFEAVNILTALLQLPQFQRLPLIVPDFLFDTNKELAKSLSNIAMCCLKIVAGKPSATLAKEAMNACQRAIGMLLTLIRSTDDEEKKGPLKALLEKCYFRYVKAIIHLLASQDAACGDDQRDFAQECTRLLREGSPDSKLFVMLETELEQSLSG